MEFLLANYINTTTQITVSSNTGTISNIFNRDPLYQYYTENFANDLTTSSITITFSATTPVSRIAMIGMNFKEFSFFYNGATANSFTLQNADTTTSSYTGNSDLNKYFKFSTIQCTSITFDAKKTITADQEKVISLLVISDLSMELPRIPSSDNYKQRIVPKQIVHKLSDGGTRIHNIRSKWETKISFDFISATQRDALYDIYSSGEPFNFCFFGTATGWAGSIYEAVWVGGFDFYEYSGNAQASGFSGSIDLRETPI